MALLGPVSRKPPELFGTAKPFLIICILKRKLCIDMKLCKKGAFAHIKNLRKEHLSKLKVRDFCYGFPGPKTVRDLRETDMWPEKFSGLSRNGPQASLCTYPA